MTTGSWIAICGFKPRFSSFPKFGLKMKMGYVGLAERYIGAGTGRKPLIFNYLLAEVLPFIPQGGRVVWLSQYITTLFPINFSP
jgi:hypothetical protein